VGALLALISSDDRDLVPTVFRRTWIHPGPSIRHSRLGSKLGDDLCVRQTA
jgi:hypothetical protein